MHPKLHGRHGKARPCWNGYPAMLCFRERAFVERVYPAMLWQLWERVYPAMLWQLWERVYLAIFAGSWFCIGLCCTKAEHRGVNPLPQWSGGESRASRGKPAPTVEQKQEQSIAG
ncbi:MAG TPA: hypothetical protein VN259_14740 [Xanthomonadales bacterium]|nr:hypothetical protein [Xanthomonadales bacterium]